jgi:dTDP-4-amino-4,6-dideoxygalactose transaminase
MDPLLIERALTPRTKAIMPVHQVGMPCDLAAILAIARKHKLPVIEDAACAVGSEIRMRDQWEKIGKPHGLIACFSFHPRKLLTTGDGGMLTTADPVLDRQFRLLRQHGMSLSDTARHAADCVLFEDYSILGFNYRLTDIQAAVGRAQLKRLPQALKQRRELANRYFGALAEIPGLEPPFVPDYVLPNHQSFPVRVQPAFGLSRDELIRELFHLRISTRRGIMNAHEERPYADATGHCLPYSEAARDDVILLPLYGSMTKAEQRYVIDSLVSLSKTTVVAGIHR